MQERRLVAAAERDRMDDLLTVADDKVLAEAPPIAPEVGQSQPERQRGRDLGHYQALAVSRNDQIAPVAAHDAVDRRRVGVAQGRGALRLPG